MAVARHAPWRRISGVLSAGDATTPPARLRRQRLYADTGRQSNAADADLLAGLSLPSWVKTSGSKGFHIVVPLDGRTHIDTVAKFAHGVGALLVRRAAEVQAARERGEATVPTTIGEERATNPFMRASNAQELAERRSAQEAFRG